MTDARTNRPTFLMYDGVVSSKVALAALYDRQGRYAEAEPLYRQALDIRRAALPAGHPDIAQSLNNLAPLYYRQGRYQEAEPLYQQAGGILLGAFGSEHPTTQAGIANHLTCLHDMGRLEAELPTLPPEYWPVLRRLADQADDESSHALPGE